LTGEACSTLTAQVGMPTDSGSSASKLVSSELTLNSNHVCYRLKLESPLQGEVLSCDENSQIFSTASYVKGVVTAKEAIEAVRTQLSSEKIARIDIRILADFEGKPKTGEPYYLVLAKINDSYFRVFKVSLLGKIVSSSKVKDFGLGLNTVWQSLHDIANSSEASKSRSKLPPAKSK
jgi:hypothetical protein